MRFFIPILTLAALAAVSTQAKEPYSVSEPHLDRLRSISDNTAAKIRETLKEFDDVEVIPRERDRKQFRAAMEAAVNIVAGDRGIPKWIDSVKNGEVPGGPVGGPGLGAVTLDQEFVESTDDATYFENDFKKAASRAVDLCKTWETEVKASTAGAVILAQCGAAQQVTTIDKKIGARVQGQIKLDFSNLKGMAIAQHVSGTFGLSTENNVYFENDYLKIKRQVLEACKTWADSLKAKSKGKMLFVQCGAPKLGVGFDQKLWVTVSGSASATHRKSQQQPTVVEQHFVKTTDDPIYFANDVAKASREAAAQCNEWATDVLKNTQATPVLVSCAGPEVIKNAKVDVRYTGKIVIAP